MTPVGPKGMKLRLIIMYAPLVMAIVGCWNPVPAADQAAFSPFSTRATRGGTTEYFFIVEATDILAFTHPGVSELPRKPADIGALSEPGLSKMFAVMGKLRDVNGELIGVASELIDERPEHDLSVGVFSKDTVWTLVISGRGSLYLSQIEDNGPVVFDFIEPNVRSGESWTGEFVFTPTIGPGADRLGMIVGGTGEFEGAMGTFIETVRITRFEPNGTSDAVLELKVSYDLPNGHIERGD